MFHDGVYQSCHLKVSVDTTVRLPAFQRLWHIVSSSVVFAWTPRKMCLVKEAPPNQAHFGSPLVARGGMPAAPLTALPAALRPSKQMPRSKWGRHESGPCEGSLWPWVGDRLSRSLLIPLDGPVFVALITRAAPVVSRLSSQGVQR